MPLSISPKEIKYVEHSAQKSGPVRFFGPKKKTETETGPDIF